jgi:AcrR family transcriptional regulator
MSGRTTRAEQREDTRRRIVRAVAELVSEAHPATVSFPAVAERAGVAVATVYRYFPNKQALLDASAMVLGDDGSVATLADYPRSFDDLADVLPAQFTALARQLPLTRNQLASPLGRELRQVRWAAKKAAVDDALRASGLDPRSPEGERFGAIADVLTSSTALLELHDKAGIAPEVAAEHVLWALQVLRRASASEARRRARTNGEEER